MSKKMMFDDQISASKTQKPFKIYFCLLLAWVLVRLFSMEKIQMFLKRWKDRNLYDAQ